MEINAKEAKLPGIDQEFIRGTVEPDNSPNVRVQVYGLSLAVFGAADDSITILFPTVGAPGNSHTLSAMAPGFKFEPAGRAMTIGSGKASSIEASPNPWSSIDRIVDVSKMITGRNLASVNDLLTSKRIQSALTLKGGTFGSAFPLSVVGQATIWRYQEDLNLYTDSAVFEVSAEAATLSWTTPEGKQGSDTCPKRVIFANVDNKDFKLSKRVDCSRLSETEGYYSLFDLPQNTCEIPVAVAGIGTKEIRIDSGSNGCNCNLGRANVPGWRP